MDRVPSRAWTNHPGTPGRVAPRLLADLAPDYATRVTVADEKTGHGITRHLRPTTRAGRARAAEDYPFIDLSTEGTGRQPGGLMWTLSVDMDHDNSLLRLFAADVPAPSWIIEKGCNGHVHAGWIIEAVAVGPNARPAPIAFAEDVRRALTLALDADPAFTNGRQWNPLWPGWDTEGRVIWGPTEPRSLSALKAEMTERGTWPTTQALHAARDTATARTLITEAEAAMQVSEGERNVFVFDMARTRRSGSVATAAEQANARCTPPLPAAEVAGIVRSIERYETRTGRHQGRGASTCGGTAWRAIQATRGRIGGSRGTPAQRIQRVSAARHATDARTRKAQARTQEAHRKARQGWTRARIAEHFGVDPRTVRRWLSTRPRRADISGASGYPRPHLEAPEHGRMAPCPPPVSSLSLSPALSSATPASPRASRPPAWTSNARDWPSSGPSASSRTSPAEHGPTAPDSPPPATSCVTGTPSPSPASTAWADPCSIP